MRNTSILVGDPRLLSSWSEVKMANEHVLVVEGKQLGRRERVKINRAEGAVVGGRDKLGSVFELMPQTHA